MTRTEELRIVALDRARSDMSGRPPSEMLALAEAYYRFLRNLDHPERRRPTHE